MSSEEANPYEAPTAIDRPEGPAIAPNPEAEAIRLAFLGRESMIKVLGYFVLVLSAYWMVFALMFLGLFALVVIGNTIHYAEFFPNQRRLSRQPALLALMVLGGIAFLGVTWGNVVVARGLRHFKRWARWVTIGFAALLIVLVMVGETRDAAAYNRPIQVAAILIFGAYPLAFIAVLLSPRASRVFAPDYAAIIAATPHLKREARRRSWVAAGIVLGLIAAGIALAAYLG